MSLKSLFSWFKPSDQLPLDYSQWIRKVEPRLLPIESHVVPDYPFVVLSVVFVVSSSADSQLLKSSLDSILNQTVHHWEVLLVTDGIKLDASLLNDQRIRVFSSSEVDFFDSANSVVDNAHGQFVTFLRIGDKLSKHTVRLVRETILGKQHTCYKLIITDEDELDANDSRCNPFFKPDWNVDYLQSFNYFSRGVLYERMLFISLGGFGNEVADPYYQLALNATATLQKEEIYHIPHVLFHLKQGVGGYRSANTLTAYTSSCPDLVFPNPLVSIIIPTKDKLLLLMSCLDGVFNHTSYDYFEVVIIDNNSEDIAALSYLDKVANDHRVKVVRYDQPFNYSDMNNLAVREAKGDFLCFLNNDISMLHDDWLTVMVSEACRPDIGCVGAKLLYPDGTVQHGGVILGLKGYASHAHKGFAGTSSGYFNRLQVVHNVSAVTAACMVVRKEVFEEVGGFDAVNLKVAYNDVDFCLKVMDAGYRNLFTPHAKLIHHESKSRGKKRKPKQQKQLREESEYFRNKWKGLLDCDPAYNKNLTLLREDFSLSKDRR